MHQEHNIPWHVLVKDTKFVSHDTSVTPPFTGLFTHSSKANPKTHAKGPTYKPNELNHFTRKFISTIFEFSDTERRKYPTTFAAPTEGKLFSDALLEKYPDFLNEKNQKIEYWISQCRAEGSYKFNEDGTERPGYSTSQAHLAEVVKILVFENQMETLLMLANHPLVPLHDLWYLSWGHSFGVDHLVHWALPPYIFFNAVASKGLLGNGKYKEMDTYRTIVNLATFGGDYPAHQIPHEEFMMKERRNGLGEEVDLSPTSGYSRWQQGFDPKKLPDVHQDLERMEAYMKLCFAILYRVDILKKEMAARLKRENGVEKEKDPFVEDMVHGVGWQEMIVTWVKDFIKGVRTSHGDWDGSKGRWISPPAFE